MKLLDQAAEWIQAHWMGLLTRREMERARKGRRRRPKGKK